MIMGHIFFLFKHAISTHCILILYIKLVFVILDRYTPTKPRAKAYSNEFLRANTLSQHHNTIQYHSIYYYDHYKL